MIKVRYQTSYLDRDKALFYIIEDGLTKLGFAFAGKVLCHPTFSIDALNKVIETVLAIEESYCGPGKIRTFNVWTERVTLKELKARELQSNSYAKQRRKII